MHYLSNLQTYGPTPGKVLPTLPIWPQIKCLKRQYDEIQRLPAADPIRNEVARAIKAQAQALLDAYFDSDEQDQVAQARQHISETYARWQREQEEGAPF